MKGSSRIRNTNPSKGFTLKGVAIHDVLQISHFTIIIVVQFFLVKLYFEAKYDMIQLLCKIVF